MGEHVRHDGFAGTRQQSCSFLVSSRSVYQYINWELNVCTSAYCTYVVSPCIYTIVCRSLLPLPNLTFYLKLSLTFFCLSYFPSKTSHRPLLQVLKAFKHPLNQDKKIDFVEQFNEKLLVKQDEENLQIVDVRPIVS